MSAYSPRWPLGSVRAVRPSSRTARDPNSEFALSLHGHDLPSDGQRVAVTGRLSGRAIEVDRWRAEPIATSTWVADRPAVGVEPEVAQANLLDAPDHWRVIESGATKTMSGGRLANLTVERLTDEMRDWLARQPEGAARLSWFIADTGASAHQAKPAPSARGESSPASTLPQWEPPASKKRASTRTPPQGWTLASTANL